VRAGKLVQLSEVKGGSSYLSQNDLRQHFGLGHEAKIDSVQIRWPSGKVENFTNVAPDAIYTVVEAQGIRGSVPLSAPPK